MSGCDHKYIHFETIRQQGCRPSFGISAAKEWKRIDRFFCEKCLEFEDKVRTADGWESKPDWY